MSRVVCTDSGSGWLAASAWTTWGVAASLAALATLGFVELNTADTAAARGAAVATSTTLADQRSTAISTAQLTLTTATKQREVECQRRGPLCRDVRRTSEQHWLHTAIAVPVPTAATIAAPGPQVTAVVRLTTWAGFGLAADDVANLRLVLMAMLPNIGGLVLCFGLALASPLRRAAN